MLELWEGSLGAVSYTHLDVYKRQELITCEKQGQYVIYAINTSAVEQMYCRFLDVFDGMALHGKAQKQEK